MPEYYLAVDGGGTKTEFCLASLATGECKHYRFGSTNYKIGEADAERNVFLQGIEHVFSEADTCISHIRGMVMGMSGVDSAEDHAHYLRIGLATGIPEDRLYVCNDSELAFYSKGVPPGLCIVAGTGSVATGIASDQRKARSGGWNNFISDEGSGGWIGNQALRAVLQYCDGYGPYFPAFDFLRETYGAPDFAALPHILSRFGVQDIAAAAKPVMEQAEEGDSFCMVIVREAAHLVANIAFSVYRRLDFSMEKTVDIVTSGSLFKSPLFVRFFKGELHALAPKDNLRFCGEVVSPVLGGVNLAKILFS
jgi:N-acetylglucosamine kinase-like BadF-type ATPase